MHNCFEERSLTHHGHLLLLLPLPGLLLTAGLDLNSMYFDVELTIKKLTQWSSHCYLTSSIATSASQLDLVSTKTSSHSTFNTSHPLISLFSSLLISKFTMSHCPIDAGPQYLKLGHFSFSSCPLLVSTRMKYFIFLSMLKRKSVFHTKNGLVCSLLLRCDDFSSSGKSSPGKSSVSLLHFTIFRNLAQDFFLLIEVHNCLSFGDGVMIFFC